MLPSIEKERKMTDESAPECEECVSPDGFKENCIEIVPTVKFCVSKEPGKVHAELDVAGTRVWGATFDASHPCASTRLNLFLFSAKFEICIDFDKWMADIKGEVCVVGKCKDFDLHIPILP